MWCRRSVGQLVRAGLPGVLAVLLAGCMAGIPPSEYDALKRRLRADDMRVAVLQEQLANQGRNLQTLAQGGAGRVTILLGAKQGASSPAAMLPVADAAPPSSFYEPLALVVYGDTVTSAPGTSQAGIDPTSDHALPAYVQSSVFRRGMRVTFRWEIVEAGSGRRLTGREVEKAVIRFPDGREIQGAFGRCGPAEDAPWLWTAAWDIPLDYPLGPLTWSIVVRAKDGKEGTFRPWVVSAPQMGAETRLQIVE